MPSANVETVFDALRRSHVRDYDGAARHFHADAVWINTPAFPGPRTCTGLEEIKEFWRTLYESFDDAGGFELLDSAERGNRVAVSVHSQGHGAASRTPIDIDWACVAQLRDGLIARVEIHGSYEKALAALEAG
jgi:ketosteroid isomerase-like protein